MTDIVAWLRALEAQGVAPDDLALLQEIPRRAGQAADEIERLRELERRLKQAARAMVKGLAIGGTP